MLSNGRIHRPHPFHRRFWRGALGKERPRIGWRQSARTIVLSSWLNALLVLIPIAWVSHFREWGHGTTFSLCFLSIIPLERIFDWGGEQIAVYCSPDLADLIMITLNNIVEATLAIILLVRCELKLLQSTITGVVLLHLLLIPGAAFLTGGAKVREQQLHPHRSQLNLTLLTIGVLALTIPSAFFSAIDTTGAEGPTGLSDSVRHDLLRISRGFAIILLIIYVCSRIYLHNPPGQDDLSVSHPDVSIEALRRKQKRADEGPGVNPWACILLLAVTVALMGVTAEFLVDSIEFVQNESKIKEEWFGIILLPFASFSASGLIAVVLFIFRKPQPPDLLAEGRAIDLSIQFLLFWMPLVTLLGWLLNKPMSMFFDIFEVVLLFGACFLVNYVTADAKTNWAEGWVLVSYYIMIGFSAWYYPGQGNSRIMNACESIVVAIADGVGQDA